MTSRLVITLSCQLCLYERRAGTGLILIVYNRFDVDTRYDRAVFFFDGDDKLTEYSSKIHDETT